MVASKQDEQQIAAVLEQYRCGFATLDAEQLKAIWDQDYENILYIAQEAALPMQGWAKVRQYYESVTESLKQVRTMTVSDLSIDVFGDIAYAFCTFHFEGETEKNLLRIADGRNTFILHRRDAMWKMIHYHESAPGPVQIA
jgi:ketosteroid isomerase-like protein